MNDGGIKTLYYRLITLEEKIDKIIEVVKEIEEYIIQEKENNNKEE